jgi:hypothetical protein
LKYGQTGTIFEVKKITNQFVILNSLDGSSQIMLEKKSFSFPLEFGKVSHTETTHEDSAQDILSPKGLHQRAGRQEKSIQLSRK